MKKKLLLLILIIKSSFLLLACQKSSPLTKPSKSFYVNDHADVFLSSTKYYLNYNSDTLYQESLSYSDQSLRGPQLVTYTYLGSENDLDTTAIFNSFGVGKNDLGPMLFIFFEEVDEELFLTAIITEIGIKMRNYLPASLVSTLIDDYFYQDDLYFQEGIVSLTYHLIATIREKLYQLDDDDTFENYLNLADFLNDEFQYFKPYETKKFSLKAWHIAVIVLVILLLGNSSFFLLPALFSSFSSTKGGGGKSLGYKFRK
ncbi:MAG: hypothetical protein M0O98_03040 [Acholeplasmataceae bacterium]|nr:hypothetical protein [Acholeplasmataceae bacterium]